MSTARFQLLTCHVALAGDMLNVVVRHAHNPVTYPELLVLKYLHGGPSKVEAVTEVWASGHADRSEDVEYARLVNVYGSATIEKLFPGAGVRLPTEDPRIQTRMIGTLRNPDFGAPGAPSEAPGAGMSAETINAIAAADLPDDQTDAARAALEAYESAPRAPVVRRPVPVSP